MKMNFTFPVLALLGGVALGYAFAPKAPAPEAKPDAPIKKRVRGQIETVATNEAVNALRARIRELEAELASARAKPAPVEEQKVAEQPQENRRGRPDWRERIEKMRRENPEEFARMEERRKKFMQERAARTQSKLDFLAAIDTSRMSKEAQKTHAELQELIAKREELGKMFSPDLEEEERRELFRSMRETDRAIRERNEKVRENLLQQTAQALGFSGDDATEIVDTIGEIYEVTTESHHRGPPPFGGRGGRGPR